MTPLSRRFFFLLAGALLTVVTVDSSRKPDEKTDRIPAKAQEVYAYVLEHHRAPPGHVGGRTFQNREHLLPRNGSYREYDVHAKVRGRNRGPERVVIDKTTRKGWYTPDHYRTFIPIPRGP